MRTAIAVMVVNVIGVPLAHAEDLRAVAATRFREGREAMRRGQYAEACSKFRESERLDASLGTELNLAVCEQRMGHYVRARALVSGFLIGASPGDERASNARRLARELDAKIAYLAVRVAADGNLSPRISIDDRPLNPADGDLVSVDPGEHRISVSAPGYLEQSRTVVVAEAAVSREDFVLVSKRRRSAAGSQPRGRESRPVSPVFYVAFAAGLAGLLTALESAAVIRMDHDKLDGHCADKSCDATGLAAGRQGRTFSAVNIVAWSTALSGSALAAYLFFDRGHAATGSLALGLALAPAQASLVVQGRTPW